MNDTVPDNTEHGSVGSDYWVKQGVQLPKHTREALLQFAETRQNGAIKLIATVAFELVLALPESACDQLCREVLVLSWDRPDQIDGEHLLKILKSHLADADEPDSDRLSPATPPVGIPSPGLSLSSAGVDQDAGESTPCTGEGNSAGESSRASLRSS